MITNSFLSNSLFVVCMKEENFGLVLLLVKKAGLFGRTIASTSQLAELTGFSQQSISRKLRELEKEGLILRKVSNLGTEIALTKKAVSELKSFYLELDELFSEKEFSLSGKVLDGLGEGKYYTSLPNYKKQFTKILGDNFFPGTLNIEVNLNEKNVLTSAEPIIITGFKTKSRSFGAIKAWKCLINKKVECIAILPERTNHKENILEVVSIFNLRKKLNIKTGSVVEVTRK